MTCTICNTNHRDCQDHPYTRKEPTSEFLLELAKALQDAEHKNVAQHTAAGLMWAMYPEWFTQVWEKRNANGKL
jgi:hypothetical protein